MDAKRAPTNQPWNLAAAPSVAEDPWVQRGRRQWRHEDDGVGEGGGGGGTKTVVGAWVWAEQERRGTGVVVVGGGGGGRTGSTRENCC